MDYNEFSNANVSTNFLQNMLNPQQDDSEKQQETQNSQQQHGNPQQQHQHSKQNSQQQQQNSYQQLQSSQQQHYQQQLQNSQPQQKSFHSQFQMQKQRQIRYSPYQQQQFRNNISPNISPNYSSSSFNTPYTQNTITTQVYPSQSQYHQSILSHQPTLSPQQSFRSNIQQSNVDFLSSNTNSLQNMTFSNSSQNSNMTYSNSSQNNKYCGMLTMYSPILMKKLSEDSQLLSYPTSQPTTPSFLMRQLQSSSVNKKHMCGDNRRDHPNLTKLLQPHQLPQDSQLHQQNSRHQQHHQNSKAQQQNSQQHSKLQHQLKHQHRQKQQQFHPELQIQQRTDRQHNYEQRPNQQKLQCQQQSEVEHKDQQQRQHQMQQEEQHADVGSANKSELCINSVEDIDKLTQSIIAGEFLIGSPFGDITDSFINSPLSVESTKTDVSNESVSDIKSPLVVNVPTDEQITGKNTGDSNYITPSFTEILQEVKMTSPTEMPPATTKENLFIDAVLTGIFSEISVQSKDGSLADDNYLKNISLNVKVEMSPDNETYETIDNCSTPHHFMHRSLSLPEGLSSPPHKNRLKSENSKSNRKSPYKRTTHGERSISLDQAVKDQEESSAFQKLTQTNSNKKGMYFENKEYFKLRLRLRELIRLQSQSDDMANTGQLQLKSSKLFSNLLTKKHKWVYDSVTAGVKSEKDIDMKNFTKRKITIHDDIPADHIHQFTECPTRPFSYTNDRANGKTKPLDKLMLMLNAPKINK